MPSLDLEAVQAFVLVADLKSFTRAAEAMDTTQSAVSLRIKRLEQELGRRLLDRTPRRVALSPDGNIFLAAARDLVAAHESAVGSFAVEQRRLAVGISHHVIGHDLSGLLRRMNAADPGLTIEMHVGESRNILRSLDDRALDAGIVLRHDTRRRGGETLLADAFGWMAAPDFAHRPGEPLRIATQSDACSVRAMGIAALDKAGIAWTEVFVGGGIATIGAAISAGLAVAALARRVAPTGSVDVGGRLGLPPLPPRDVMLYATAFDPPARRALRLLAASFKATA
jgi:DNA-binding transcriptional LysR family regulator